MLVSLLFLFVGVALWTFSEYVIHRFLGHNKNNKGIVRKEHKKHHAVGDYFVPMVKKISIAVIVLITLIFLVGFVFNFQNGLMFSLGYTAMYLIYEMAHKIYHLKAPIIRYGLRMRKHHFYHHFGNPKYNHGVTTAFWDRLFGTYQPVNIVSVPKKMTLAWLKEPSIADKYQNHFRIK